MAPHRLCVIVLVVVVVVKLTSKILLIKNDYEDGGGGVYLPELVVTPSPTQSDENSIQIKSVKFQLS